MERNEYGFPEFKKPDDFECRAIVEYCASLLNCSVMEVEQKIADLIEENRTLNKSLKQFQQDLTCD